MFNALQQDYPALPWGKMAGEAWAQTWEGTLTALPLILLGAGPRSRADVNSVKSLLGNHEVLKQVGFDAAQIELIQKPPNAEGKVEALRSLWDQRKPVLAENKAARTPEEKVIGRPWANPGDVAAAGFERTQQMRAVFGNPELRGKLPYVSRTEDGHFQLKFPDGPDVTFDKWADAEIAYWDHAKLDAIHVADGVREYVGNRLSQLGEGDRPVEVEFPQRMMTDKLAVEEGRATPEKIEKRKEQAKTLTVEDADADRAIGEAFSITADPAASEVVWRILGSNQAEYRENVLHDVVRLWKGHTALTPAEEFAERDAAKIIATKEGREWMITALRDVEAKTGAKLLGTENNAALENSDLVEGYSHLATAMYLKEARDGNPLFKAGRKESATYQGYVNYVREQLLDSKAGPAMIAMGRYLKSFQSRADMLGKLEAEGKLPEELRGELEKSLGMSKGTSERAGKQNAEVDEVNFALDMNPNKAVGMAASKVPVVAEAPPVAFAENVKDAGRSLRILMEQSSARVRARGGMMINLANPDKLRAEWLKTDPESARIAHALNSSSSGYRQPDPSKVRSAPLTRHTLINADMMVIAKNKAGRDSPTWIKVYVDSTSPTGELWHFVVTDEKGDFQTQYSASSIAGTSAQGAVVKAAGDRAPRNPKTPTDPEKPKGS
jgi:hypothetical protein